MHQQNLDLFEPPFSPLPTEHKVLEVHRRLCSKYGCPTAYFHQLDQLGDLMSALLSHRTHNRDSDHAYRNLCARFADWAAVRDAPVAEVEQAIAACTWPQQKAPRIQAVLKDLTTRCNGELSLDFLRDKSVSEARA